MSATPNRFSRVRPALVAVFLLGALAIPSMSMEISISPKPKVGEKVTITVDGVTSTDGLTLRLTSRDKGTVDHTIGWGADGKGVVEIDGLTAGSYIASVADANGKTQRVKAFKVDGVRP